MIKLNRVGKIYNKDSANEYRALENIDFTVNDGEMVAIIGKSGAGKSTLLHVLACIDSYEEGEYYLDNLLIKNLNEKNLSHIRNSKIGIVMQDFALIDDFSCIENVMLPLDFAKVKRNVKLQKAMTALESVGMSQMAKKTVNRLSGGQKQRVAIARAIVNDPSVILTDEPTGALDTNNSAEIMSLFHLLHDKGCTMIIVTHDMEIAKQCERIIEITDGKIING